MAKWKHDSIWNNESLLREKASEAVSIVHLLDLLGIPRGGGSQSRLTKILKDWEIPLPDSKATRAKKAAAHNARPDDEVFVENSTYTNRRGLRQRLLASGQVKYVCAQCTSGPEWNDRPLTLQLDHINGVSTDNRLENLRFLCPNCHSQTETYAGKNRRTIELTPYPEDDVLLKMVEESSTAAVARQLGRCTSSIAHKIRRIKGRDVDTWLGESVNS